MGLFGRKKSNSKLLDGEDGAPSPNGKRSNSKRRSKKKSGKVSHDVSPSMESVPDYIDRLANVTSEDTGGEVAASALRALFSLSEHANNQDNREKLVHAAEGQVVPTLLDFLHKSAPNSSEQYLALLVLNNVSIPADNKKFIAVDCGGAHILSRLLCHDVSCHLMAIILVNLTFADAELRRELVSPAAPTQLVDALAYALICATASPQVAESLPQPVGPMANAQPREMLVATMQKSSSEQFESFNFQDSTNVSQFPETARWCLCAIKNLTRPSKDPLAAHAIIDTGIVPLLLRIVTTDFQGNSNSDTSASLKASDPMQKKGDEGVTGNPPHTWEANSIQDAALFSLLNLATVQPARHYLREVDAVHTLSMIADCTGNNQGSGDTSGIEQFQCLKARMAMAYLVGGEGHFGQSKARASVPVSLDESVLLIMTSEAEQLEELLVNTLHQRAKEGPGGYSAATFTCKGVLFAIRCLLTHNLNQSTFCSTCGVKLNCLLMKALAQHSISRVLTIDAEAAAHAAFSLYLLSSYGFNSPFLTSAFYEDGLAEKILTSYLHMENITLAGQHAADQLLLRLPYLQHIPNPIDNDKFASTVFESDEKTHDNAWDYDLDVDLLDAARNIRVERRVCGAEPLPVIFNRPILRRRAPKKNQNLSWSDRTAVTVIPNVLLATQDLSFGSTKVRHMDAIDDILIANNIANSTNGEKTESYNFLWMWQDAAEELARAQKGKGSAGFKGFLSKMKPNTVNGKANGGDEPFSFFGLRCGPVCASDGVVMDDDTLTTMETRQSQRDGK